MQFENWQEGMQTLLYYKSKTWATHHNEFSASIRHIPDETKLVVLPEIVYCWMLLTVARK